MFLSRMKTFEGCVGAKLIAWIYFSFLFLFISAASDHYLIGNNITVAVLGIVIPIGEYYSCFFSLFACFSQLASPSRLVAQVLHVVRMCYSMCLAGCGCVVPFGNTSDFSLSRDA